MFIYKVNVQRFCTTKFLTKWRTLQTVQTQTKLLLKELSDQGHIATDRALSKNCWYLSYFSMNEALLMSTHNICFRWEIRKILCGYPLLSVAMGHKIYTICHFTKQFETQQLLHINQKLSQKMYEKKNIKILGNLPYLFKKWNNKTCFNQKEITIWHCLCFIEDLLRRSIWW